MKVVHCKKDKWGKERGCQGTHFWPKEKTKNEPGCAVTPKEKVFAEDSKGRENRELGSYGGKEGFTDD